MTDMIEPSNTTARGRFARVAQSRAASRLLLVTLFWFAAAAGFSGFAGKWGLREADHDSYRFGAAAIFNSTAARPFIYRQLGPALANLAARVTPASAQQYLLAHIDPSDTFDRLVANHPTELQFKIEALLYISFFSLFFSLFVLRQVALEAGSSRLAAIMAPVTLALAMPYLQTVGGYYYDSIELLCMSLAVLLSMRGQVMLLLALVAPATLNKESFALFLPALYPLLRTKLTKLHTLVVSGSAMAIGGLVNVLVKREFAGAPGSPIEVHLHENLFTYSRLWAYREWDQTYGLIGPRGFFLGTVFVVAVILQRGLARCPPAIRLHLAYATVITIPLWLLFGSPGELRNLSFMFVGFCVVMAQAMERHLATGQMRAPPSKS